MVMPTRAIHAWETVCPLCAKGPQIILLSQFGTESISVTPLNVRSHVLFLLAYLSLAASFLLSLCF